MAPRPLGAAPLWRAIAFAGIVLLTPQRVFRSKKEEDQKMSKKKPQDLKEQENVEKDTKTKEFSKTRKYQITINNPTKHGLQYDDIYRKCTEMEPEYFCMSEEVGTERHTSRAHLHKIH